jgi:transcriptional regulator GlxA family with amidase domain
MRNGPAAISAKTEEFIELNIGSPLKVSDLASHAHLSLFHFCRLIRAQTGMTPKMLLTTIRMDRARLLLGTTDLGVKQVAASVGIHLSTFERRFRDFCGRSPAEYRRAARPTDITPAM